MPRFAEFFAGAGMVRAAFGPRWDLAFANDIDPKKCASYRANWGGDHLLEGDVAQVDPQVLRQPIDLYWASSPCQDLSLAGARKGLNGSRSSAFFAWMTHVSLAVKAGFAPRILAFENVRGLITSNNGKDFQEVARAFRANGYRFGALEIDASHFLPQSRPRVFVIGARDDLIIPQQLLSTDGKGPFHSEQLKSFAHKLPDDLRSHWVWWNLALPTCVRPTLGEIIEFDHRVMFDEAEVQRLLSMMNVPSRSKIDAARNSKGLHDGTIYKRGRPSPSGDVRQRAEVRFDGLAGCLRTPAGGSSRQSVVIVRDGQSAMRLLTTREAVRLMGLDDSYVLPPSYNDAYKLAGDGVAVPVVRHLDTGLFQPLLSANSLRVAA